MNRKDELLNQMIDHPLKFKRKEFMELVSLVDDKGDKQVTFEDLRQNLLRIYDMNERSLQDQSNPMLGSLKKPNTLSNNRRRKKYYRKIQDNFRSNKDNLVVVAEGDSWFQFPFFVRDIIDWLMECPQLAIYSLAAGGDWMANMIYEGKYIEELSIHKPDVFLISGGGNDFIGGNRLAVMVDKKGECDPCFTQDELLALKLLKGEAEKFFVIQKYINKEFYAFIWTLKTQYWILFEKLANPKKFPGLKVITQGYDNVIPSHKNHWCLQYPWQYFVNRFVDTGQWLMQPLQIKGITEKDIQQWIMRYLIFKVNQMFIELAEEKNERGEYRFPNVYHIDCRGIAQRNDWFDEIHLKSHAFKKVADAYLHCIFNNPPMNKVIVARTL